MLPPLFIQQINKQFLHEANDLLAALELPSQTSIRLHPKRLNESHFAGEQIPWYKHGYVLATRPSFIADPLWHAGAYYVQESSSMYIAAVIKYIKNDLNRPLRILDLSAAPGGKSTLIMDMIDENDLLVCNEPIKSRAAILAENCIRWGYPNVIVTRNHPSDFLKLKGFFDVVLVDAPCSGEGMFRKDHAARNEWSMKHVALCAARQESILQDVATLVTNNGYLIYATCTFNEMENEERVAVLQANGFESIPLPIFDGLYPISTYAGKTLHAIRFLPHRTGGEGLFISCLKQIDGMQYYWPKHEKSNSLKASPTFTSYMQMPEEFSYFNSKEKIIALPKKHAQSMTYLQKYLNIVNAGITLGNLVHGKFIPHHALAMSLYLSPNLTRTNIALKDAYLYLQKGNLSPDLFNQKGLQLVCYHQHILGWVNVLPNRVNNYLPAHLRVLKDLNV
jgi:16S rRNA C967 or C1407 C5-methylase (RsmB/RsmF family)/NOL1/NOP2/fmu family ribosome biogenesis protein